MTYLLPSFRANSTRTIHQCIVNVPKDTKIDANTFIVFIASCTACKTVLEDGISYSQAFFVKFFVKFVINSMSQIQNVQPNLANIIEATALVPENDRICSDCPHATAILIMASYVDDNLTFTNCAALAAELKYIATSNSLRTPRDLSTGIYPSNTTVIQLQEQRPLTNLHRQTAEEMGHGTVQPSTYTISTESR